MIPPHDALAPIALAPTPPVQSYNHYRITIHDAPTHPTLGYRFAVVSRILLRNPAGDDIGLAATMTYSSRHPSYTGDVHDVVTADWANGADLPAEITFSLPAADAVASYEFSGPFAGGNDGYYASEWTLEGSDDLVTFTQLDFRTGQVLALGETKTYTVP